MQNQTGHELRCTHNHETTKHLAMNKSCERHVSFGTKTTNYHDMIVGDHPCRAPLTISWKPHSTVTEKISDSVQRRNLEDLRMDSAYRFRLLLQSGFSMETIASAAQISRSARKLFGTKDGRTQAKENRDKRNTRTTSHMSHSSRSCVKRRLRESLTEHRRTCSKGSTIHVDNTLPDRARTEQK